MMSGEEQSQAAGGQILCIRGKRLTPFSAPLQQCDVMCSLTFFLLGGRWGEKNARRPEVFVIFRDGLAARGSAQDSESVGGGAMLGHAALQTTQKEKLFTLA